MVYLKKRYGFVKVAMEAGAHIVPTFCFGQVCVHLQFALLDISLPFSNNLLEIDMDEVVSKCSDIGVFEILIVIPRQPLLPAGI